MYQKVLLRQGGRAGWTNVDLHKEMHILGPQTYRGVKWRERRCQSKVICRKNSPTWTWDIQTDYDDYKHVIKISRPYTFCANFWRTNSEMKLLLFCWEKLLRKMPTDLQMIDSRILKHPPGGAVEHTGVSLQYVYSTLAGQPQSGRHPPITSKIISRQQYFS